MDESAVETTEFLSRDALHEEPYFLCFIKHKRSFELTSKGFPLNLTSGRPLRGCRCTLEGNMVGEGWVG